MVASIYLSPHLDDVALSCGGQIFQQTHAGEEVLIVTLMAGVPAHPALSSFAQQQHTAWGFAPDLPAQEVADVVVKTRRAEDEIACRWLGARPVYGPWPDCIYRCHPTTGTALYTSDSAIFSAIHPAEEELIAAIATFLATLPPAGRVVAPLGVGHHVDHQLTRRAAEAYFGSRLWYYADYPYAQRDPAHLARLTADHTWPAEHFSLDEAAIAARIAAVAAYASQLDMLFNGSEAMPQALRTFIQDTGGERLWRRPGAVDSHL